MNIVKKLKKIASAIVEVGLKVVEKVTSFIGRNGDALAEAVSTATTTVNLFSAMGVSVLVKSAIGFFTANSMRPLAWYHRIGVFLVSWAITEKLGGLVIKHYTDKGEALSNHILKFKAVSV